MNELRRKINEIKFVAEVFPILTKKDIDDMKNLLGPIIKELGNILAAINIEEARR